MSVSPKDLIGKIVVARMPYYDNKKNKIGFKGRPALIIGAEKTTFPCDFTLLPLSRVNHSQHIHSHFDIKLNEENCKSLNLNSSPSYIRCHKPYTTSSSDISADCISDLKNVHEAIYIEVEEAFINFSKELF